MKAFGVFLLAFGVASLPVRGGQNQNSQHNEHAASIQSDQAPQAEQQQAGDEAPSQPQQDSQAPQAQPLPAVPLTLTIPAGSLISVRINQWLSSDRNHTGDIFSAVLDQPILANGWVVARRGQSVIGRIDVAQKASEGNGVSRLGLEITELTLVDGEQVPVSTEVQQAPRSPAAAGSTERNAATVGTTTVLGTIVGAALGGGQGAAIGAGLGATAGIATILYTRGRATTLAPETLLSFRLQAPVAVSTEKGQVAFQPVTQGDYKDQDAYANSPRRRAAGPGYPPPYYYGYCGPWGWNCYAGPYFGPYVGIGIWGYGPRFGGYGRFRR